MKNDALINKIAHTTGCSRKEVLDTLKALRMISGSPKQPINKVK